MTTRHEQAPGGRHTEISEIREKLKSPQGK